MKKVQFFFPSQTYIQAVENLVETHKKRIVNLIPTARVEHVGGTAVPNLMTKGDLDLEVAVSADNFNRAMITFRALQGAAGGILIPMRVNP